MARVDTKPAEVRIAVVWVALIALTITVRLVSHEATLHAVVGTVVLAATMTKVWLVVHHYMEIGRAPLWLKALCDAWIVAVFAVLYLLVVDGGRIIGLK